MRSRCAGVAGVFALFIGLLAAPYRVQARAESRAPAPTDLSGVWVLDPEPSDDAQDKMRGMMPGGEGGPPEGMPPMPPMPPGGGMAGPGGGMGGPGGGMGPGERAGEDPREAMGAVFEPAEEIWITQTAREIEVDETYGRLRRFRPDGKRHKTDNGAAEMKAEWKDGLLHVETTRGREAKLLETWELSPDGNRLTVKVTLGGGRMPKVTLKHVYDRAEEEEKTGPNGR